MPRKRIFSIEEMYEARDSYERQANSPTASPDARKVGREASDAIGKKIKRDVKRKYPKA